MNFCLCVCFLYRLLCSLYSGLPLLWVPNFLQHRAGLCYLRLLCGGRRMFLLLLCDGGVWRLWPALRHGLWHHRRLLRVRRLPGDLYGVLQPLLLLLRPVSYRNGEHRSCLLHTPTSPDTTSTGVFMVPRGGAPGLCCLGSMVYTILAGLVGSTLCPMFLTGFAKQKMWPNAESSHWWLLPSSMDPTMRQ